MVTRFKQEATSINLPAAAKKGNLTENQVITVASILMAEGGNPKYYPKIAEVIYNRLNQGIPLQLDSTVNFALAKTGIGLPPRSSRSSRRTTRSSTRACRPGRSTPRATPRSRPRCTRPTGT